MKTWQKAANDYAAQGLRPCEVTRRIEEEFGLTGMYDRVQKYIKRHGPKNKKSLTNTLHRQYKDAHHRLVF